MPFQSKVQDDPEKSTYLIGFNKGLNTLQNKSLVDNKNLIEALNVEYVVDGVRRRKGSTRVFDDGSASKVYGSYPYYKKSAGTRKFIRAAKARIQYLNGSTWTDIDSTVFSNAETNFIQARDYIFIYNGIDSLRKYDNSTITTYTQITTPVGLTVTPTYKDSLSITGITRSGSVATATTASAHGQANGASVTISGATQTEYNGTFVITVLSATTFSYTVSGTPATPATGTITLISAGTSSYSYRVSAFNSTGETLACVAVATTTGPSVADMSALKYNALSWTATSGAVGYNVYGRTATGFGEVYLSTVYTNSYNDVGTDAPATAKLPQSANNTGGIIAKGGCFTSGRQFVYGVTDGSTYQPCRIAYSGVLNYIDSFVGNEFGGGWIDVSANDGGEIVGIAPYQSGVLVFKTNGIFKLSFTVSGGTVTPVLQEITRSHGGVSFRAIQQIDNDVVYVGQKENRIAVFTIGQQQNYTGDQLRTNELSVFIKDDLMNANRAYLSNIASFYYDDKFGFTYTKTGDTENSVGYVIDTKFGAWAKWNGPPMAMTHYTVYDDGTNVHLYGGANNSGYMWELMKNDRNDNGAAFQSIIGTKHFNGDMFNVEKIWRNPTFWFKYISGGELSCEAWTDGTQYQGAATFSSGAASSGISDLPGTFLCGDFYGEVPITVENADVPMEISKMFTSRTIGFYLIDDGINSDWLFMGINLNYSLLEGKPLQERYRIQMS